MTLELKPTPLFEPSFIPRKYFRDVASPEKKKLISSLETAEEQTVFLSLQSKDRSTSSSSEPQSRTHLFVIDDSPHSQSALEEVIEKFVDKAHDTVVILNIRAPIKVDKFAIKYGDVTFFEYLKSMDNKARDNAHNMLHKYSSNLINRGYNVIATALRGDIQEEIKRNIEVFKADSIVISVSDRSV